MRAKRGSILLLSLSTSSILACSTASPAQRVNMQDPVVAAIDSTNNRMMSLGISPGLGVVVVRDTQVMYMKGFGFADVAAQRPFTPQTVFYIASTTKSFTGLAAAILDEQKKFSLDAPLSRYLPSLQLKAPLRADSITIRSLLTHTHGISNSGPVTVRLAHTGEYAGNEQLARLLIHHGAAESGTAFRYGNIGYNVATLAMDAHLRRGWKETLQSVLFTPLGMTSTSGYVSRFPRERLAMPYRFTTNGFQPTPYGKFDSNMQSAGGLVTTLEDMSRWLEVHINDGRLNGKQVLPSAAVKEAHKVLAPTDANVRGNKMLGYGLGWNIMVMGTDTVLAHGGGFVGFTTHMSFIPGKRIGVAVFANNAELGPFTEVLAQEIYRLINSGSAATAKPLEEWRAQVERGRQAVIGELNRRAARPQTLPYPIAAYVGDYDNPIYGRLQMRAVNNKLEARIGHAWSAIEVFDATKNQLRIEIFGEGNVLNVQMKGDRAEVLSFNGQSFQRVGS
jgi:CubicO group peptidase (beta-lactamase class C family)